MTLMMIIIHDDIFRLSLNMYSRQIKRLYGKSHHFITSSTINLPYRNICLCAKESQKIKTFNLNTYQLPVILSQNGLYKQYNSKNMQLVRNYSWFSGNGLQNAISDAEKSVGYPTSFNSWKYLFDEEPATFIGLARKIVGSGHPLLQTARDILSQDPYSSNHLGGLWVLLISKAAGVNPNIDVDTNFVQGIHQKQRILAETTELINTAFLIHKNMLDLTDDSTHNGENKKTLEFGNKLFVLGGDFLLSKASVELAKLENTDVVALIGQAIGDMAEGVYLEDTTTDVSSWNQKTWADYIYLLRGSLMANSCKSSMILMEHGDEAGQNAHNFGLNLVLAQHCRDDIESFLDKKQLLKRTNFLLSKALETNSKEEILSYIKNSPAVWKSLDANRELKSLIRSLQTNIVEEARYECERYVEECVKMINLFPHLETVQVVESVLRNMSTEC